jgi:thiamine pyrophosphate-dependent acetolactate synthase large subunit-like protein
MTGGEALVAALVGHGVDTVFGIPGTHNLEIYRHLAVRRVRHVGTRHEQGAGYAADGYARTTGRPGVAVVTSGPGLLNAAAAVGQAYSDSVPVLLVSPGMPLRHPGFGAGLLHETKDQSAALAAVAAASIQARSVAEIPVAVAQAFSTMTEGRPRPVHLEVPFDVLDERGDVVVTGPVRTATRVAPAAQLAAAAERLAAGRVMVIAGGGARRAAEELRLLAERLAAPVVTTANGKGVLAEDHPLALGAGAHLPAVRDLVQESDVVLAVGTELAPSDLWNGPLPLAGRLVRVDVDPVAVVTNAVPDVAVVGDAAASLRELLKRLPERAPDDRAGRWRDRKRADARAEGAEWLPIIDALASALPRDAVVAGDSAMVCYYGALGNLPAHAASAFLYPTGYGTLGYGLPAAIGAKVAQPERPVVALLGDGGVMFTVAELATAAALRIALPVVVVDNGGYGEIRNEMVERDDPVHAVTLPTPDFAALGRSLGCRGVTLDGPALLTAALTAAFAAERPTVIHLRHDPGTQE